MNGTERKHSMKKESKDFRVILPLIPMLALPLPSPGLWASDVNLLSLDRCKSVKCSYVQSGDDHIKSLRRAREGSPTLQ